MKTTIGRILRTAGFVGLSLGLSLGARAADVARVEETAATYPSLQDAVTAATMGQTVTLLDAATITASVTVDKDLAINLGGKTLTRTNAGWTEDGRAAAFDVTAGSVAITNGTVTCESIKADAILVRNCAALTLDDVSVQVNSVTGSCVYALGDSRVTIDGGSYKNQNPSTSGYGSSQSTACVNTNSSGTVTVNAGNFYGMNPSEGGKNAATYVAPGRFAYFTGLNGSPTIFSHWEVKAGYPVASVHGLACDTLEEAVSAAQAGEVVRLHKSVSVDAAIAVAKSVTIDLGGNAVTRSNKNWTEDGRAAAFDVTAGTVVITNGAVKCESLKADAILARNDAALTLADLVVQVNSVTGSCVYALGSSTVAIAGGSYKNQNTSISGSGSSPNTACVNTNSTGAVAISSGNFHGMNPALGGKNAATYLADGAYAYFAGTSKNAAAFDRWEVKGETPAVTVRSAAFATLQNALDWYVASNDVITVRKDFALDATATFAKPVTLDLGGKTVTLGDGATQGLKFVAGEGNAVSNGTVASARSALAANTYCLYFAGAAGTVEGVKVDAKNTDYAVARDAVNDNAYAAWATYFETDPSVAMTLEDVVVTNANGCAYYFEYANVALTNCSAHAADPFGACVANHDCAIYSTLNARVAVSGGEYDYGALTAVQVGNLGGRVSVADDAAFTGTVKSWQQNGAHADCEAYEGYNAKITVESGAFKGGFWQKDATSTNMVWDVRGGTFDADPTAYCADCYCAMEQDGTWSVIYNPVAKIGEKIYTSLASALAAAQPGETVTLIANRDEQNLTVPEEVTLDLGSYTNTTVGLVNKGTIKVYQAHQDISVGGKSYLELLANVPGTLLAGEVIKKQAYNQFINYFKFPADTTINLATNWIGGNIQPTITVNVPNADMFYCLDVGSYKKMVVNGKLYFGAIYGNWTAKLADGLSESLKTELIVTGTLGITTSIEVGDWAEVSVVGTVSINTGKKVTLKGLHSKFTHKGNTLVANDNIVSGVAGYMVVKSADGEYTLAKAQVKAQAVDNATAVGVLTNVSETATTGWIDLGAPPQPVDAGSWVVVRYKANDGYVFGDCAAYSNSAPVQANAAEVTPATGLPVALPVVCQVASKDGTTTNRYSSLAAAVAAAGVNATITLLKDVTTEGISAIAKTLTLDLNGCTLSNATALAVTSSVLVKNGKNTSGGLVIDGAISVSGELMLQELGWGVGGIAVNRSGSLDITAANAGVAFPAGATPNWMKANNAKFFGASTVAGAIVVVGETQYTYNGTTFTTTDDVATAEVAGTGSQEQSLSYVESYTTLAAALAAVTNNGTVTLLKTVEDEQNLTIRETTTLDLTENAYLISTNGLVNNGTIKIYMPKNEKQLAFLEQIANVPGTLLAGSVVSDYSTMQCPAGTTVNLATNELESGNVVPTVTVTVPDGGEFDWDGAIGPYKQMFVTGDVGFCGNVEYGLSAEHKTFVKITGNLRLFGGVTITNNAAMEVVGNVSCQPDPEYHPETVYTIALTATDATFTQTGCTGDPLVANSNVVSGVAGYHVVRSDAGVYTLAKTVATVQVGENTPTPYVSLADAIEAANADANAQLDGMWTVTIYGDGVIATNTVVAPYVMVVARLVDGGSLTVNENVTLTLGDGAALGVGDANYTNNGAVVFGDAAMCIFGDIYVGPADVGCTIGIASGVVTQTMNTVNAPEDGLTYVLSADCAMVLGYPHEFPSSGLHANAKYYLPVDATFTVPHDQCATAEACILPLNPLHEIEYDDDGNGNYVYAAQSNFVCEVVSADKTTTNRCSTLKKAAAKVAAGGTIKLIADAAAGDLTLATAATLDLNGFTLTVDAGETFTANANLAVVNSSDPLAGGLVVKGSVAANAAIDLWTLGYNVPGGLVAHQGGGISVGASGSVTFMEAWKDESANALKAKTAGFLTAVDGAKVITGKTYAYADGVFMVEGAVATATCEIEIVGGAGAKASYVDSFDAFADAVAAVTANGAVTLVTDASIDATATFAKPATLDLGGHELTSTAADWALVAQDVALTVSNGTITASAGKGIKADDAAGLALVKVTLEANLRAIQASNLNAAIVPGALTIDAETVVSSDSEDAILCGNGNSDVARTVSIAGSVCGEKEALTLSGNNTAVVDGALGTLGTKCGAIYFGGTWGDQKGLSAGTRPTLTINGTVYAYNATGVVWTDYQAGDKVGVNLAITNENAVIEGGIYGVIFQAPGTVKVSAGTITGQFYVGREYEDMSVSIAGGEFGSVASDPHSDGTTYPALAGFITGGAFHADPEAYVAEGYYSVKSGAKWIVTDTFYRVGDDVYASLEDARAASAASGEAIMFATETIRGVVRNAGAVVAGATTNDSGAVVSPAADGALVLPERVGQSESTPLLTGIGYRAYAKENYDDKVSEDEKLTSVELSRYVTRVGDDAFAGCEKLTNVVFKATRDDASGVTNVLEVGSGAFEGTALKRITIPADAIVKLSANTFANCANLTELYVYGKLDVKGLKKGAFNKAGNGVDPITIHLSPTLAADADYVYALTNGMNTASVKLDSAPLGTVAITSGPEDADGGANVAFAFSVKSDSPWTAVTEDTVKLFWSTDLEAVPAADRTYIGNAPVSPVAGSLAEDPAGGGVWKVKFAKPAGARYYQLCVGE